MFHFIAMKCEIDACPLPNHPSSHGRTQNSHAFRNLFMFMNTKSKIGKK